MPLLLADFGFVLRLLFFWFEHLSWTRVMTSDQLGSCTFEKREREREKQKLSKADPICLASHLFDRTIFKVVGVGCYGHIALLLLPSLTSGARAKMYSNELNVCQHAKVKRTHWLACWVISWQPWADRVSLKCGPSVATTSSHSRDSSRKWMCWACVESHSLSLSVRERERMLKEATQLGWESSNLGPFPMCDAAHTLAPPPLPPTDWARDCRWFAQPSQPLGRKTLASYYCGNPVSLTAAASWRYSLQIYVGGLLKELGWLMTLLRERCTVRTSIVNEMKIKTKWPQLTLAYLQPLATR